MGPRSGGPTLHRTFPRIPDLPVSILGLGAMRLPTVAGDPSRIDEEAAARLVHDAVAGGVNYLDTAWPYHGGQSEPFLGRALAGGLRAQVQLATKCPVWEVQQEGDWERLLDVQLARLATDRVDFYLLHALNGERWEAVGRLGGMAAMERARADGRIRHLGFSFHGALDDFRRIVDAHPWAFCQIQLNYLDEGFQAGLAGLRHAAERGVGVVVMEPLRGGALARPPPPVQAIWERAGRPWSAAEWALRWVWGLPGVVTVLSGMSALDQLHHNLSAAARAAPLSPEELGFVEEAKAFYAARRAVPCTTCGYCAPCPNGVAIPDVFAAYNDAIMLDARPQAAWAYKTFVLNAQAGADRCNACGTCEPLCPQKIAIPERLEQAHALLTGA